jgi:ABC-type nitrate/sulfonate/bicarbonate transport system substrate-binding protein
LSFALAALSSPALAAQRPPSPKLMIAVPTISAGEWPYYVAIEKGLYREANLDAELVITETNTKAIQGLVSGSLHIGGGSPDPLIKAVAQTGANLIIVGAVINRPVYSLIVQPDIRNYQDLKGKRAGVSAMLSMDGLWMRQMLESNGLREGEVEIVEIGGTAQRYLALKAKGIAAGFLTQPQDFRALREGFKRLGLSTEIVKEMVWTAYCTTRTWARQNEETLYRFLTAQRKAHQWLYDSKNRDEAIRILAKATNTDQQEAAQTYALWIEQKTLSLEGETTPGAVKAMIDALVATKQLKEPLAVERVADFSYLDKVRKAEAGK